MSNRVVIFLKLIAMFYVIYCPLVVDSCNEAVCASIVSKCLLTDACKCDLKICSCCKDCFQCLDNARLWTECCSCVGMCPKPNATMTGITNISTVEDLFDPIPSLFVALVSETDSLDRWTPLSFPVDYRTDTLNLKIKNSPNTIIESNVQKVDSEKRITTLNCSVAFMSECMPWNECRDSCNSMGASSVRWFHDGCCECVGESCITYGVDENRCGCSFDVIPNDVELLDYGEDDHIEL